MSLSISVDSMHTPPVVGKVYYVRCVNYVVGSQDWHDPEDAGREFWLPVLGGAHTDKQIGSVAACNHVHFDFRFMSMDLLQKCFGVLDWVTEDKIDPNNFDLWGKLMGQVRFQHSEILPQQPPMVFTKRFMRCVRPQPEFPVIKEIRWGFLPVYAGLTYRVEEICAGLKMDPANPVCPHRGVPLGSMPVDRDNCVTCPAHGLRFHRYTGEMVSRYGDCPAWQRQDISEAMQRYADRPCEGKLPDFEEALNG